MILLCYDFEYEPILILKLFGLVWFLDDCIYMMAVSLHVSLIKIEA